MNHLNSGHEQKDIVVAAGNSVDALFKWREIFRQSPLLDRDLCDQGAFQREIG
jgi:hypothetical protein